MSDLLRIATSGLLSSQKTLDTISNNISNASVPEYNRQVTTLGTLPSLQVGKLFYGSGVDVQGTQRIVNQFVIEALRSQNTAVGEKHALTDILDQIDKLFSDPSLGITEGLNNFFDALQSLNADPASIPARSIFIAQANILTDRFNEIYNQTYNHFGTINAEITESVFMINKYATQLADINLRLQTIGETSFGATPNDLLDLREKILLDLSEFVGISINKNPDDTVDVFIGNGQTLVIGTQTTPLSTAPNDADPFKLDVVISNQGVINSVNTFFDAGKVAGLMEVRDSVLPGILNSIGRIAIAMARSFNQTHAKGIDLYGDIGGLMFTEFNEYEEKIARVQSNSHNTGDAVFSVEINAIQVGNEPATLYSDPVTIANAGSLNILNTGTMTINGIAIRAAIPADDTVSTTDNLASALAISNAINASTNSHLVQAQATQTVYNLGQFTAGALVAGNLTINGAQILSTGVDAQTVVQDINNLKFQTGVKANIDANNNISLVAEDGRNIQLTKTVNSTGATFSYLTLDAGAASDNVVRGSVKLTAPNNRSITIAGLNPQSLGFDAQTVPQTYAGLSIYDYELSYNGLSYSLRRLPDSTLVATSSTPNFTLDGFTIALEAGTAAAGDLFVIHPTQTAGQKLTFLISDPARLALANPIKAQSALSNKGTGNIQVAQITNTTGIPASVGDVLGNAFSAQGQLSPPLRIQFTTNSTYIVLDMSQGEPGRQIGPEQIYNSNRISTALFPIDEVVDHTFPGPNPNYVYDPGFRVNLSGVMVAGDTFDIEYNLDAKGDSTNGLLMASLQFEKTMQNRSATFQDSYTQFIGDIGSQTLQSKISFDASNSLFKSIDARRNEISGVNLDEEAANLLRFEQAYQACAQVIFIAKGVFDSLLRAVGA